VVEEAGYLVEEYHLDGTAVAYGAAPGTRLGVDGRWETVVIGEAGYRTRILVVRPGDPARFNGTVLLNWQNVSAGIEGGAPRRGEMYRGYAWVGVSAQEVGLYGFPAGMTGRTGSFSAGRPLVDHDPQRYGDLRHPGDQGSFDIFTQAARAVGPTRNSSVDPMGGLDVRRVVATGGSQSAMRLVAYINAVHPTDQALDGFLLSLWEGRAPAVADGSVSFGGVRTTVRADGAVPVLVVNSEFEALSLHAVGIADTDTIRVWEVAGAPHASVRNTGRTEAGGRWMANPLSIAPVHESAVRHLHQWLAQGTVPPAQPRIQILAGPPATIDRDPAGNALGGIRLPELAAPTAEYRGLSAGTGRAPLFGASRPFSDETLRALYPTRRAFAERWRQGVDDLVVTGAVLADDAGWMQAHGDEIGLPVD
jgi:hypothetical protein